MVKKKTNDNSKYATKAKGHVVDELHKPARKNYRRRRVIIRAIDDIWASDLADMSNYSKFNKGYTFILVVIDCFSKYLWTRPLKSKSAENVTKAMSDILEKAKGRKPVNFHTDQGREYINSKFGQLMQHHNINQYNTFSVKKASIAERVIRTLKNKLFKLFSLNGSYNWADILEEVTNQINRTKHRTIGVKPIDVNKSNEKEIYQRAYSHLKIADKRKFKVGDIVRISKMKHLFAKGYTPNWTTELFRIARVRITNPTTYLLEDLNGQSISGGFYTEELQKTAQPDVYLIEKVLKRKGNKLFVKYLGFADNHNSWINASDIV